jgi:hypothetical protein
LGYNQSHYESFHPCTNADILASINLVTENLENRYRFSKQDLPFLIGLDGNSSIDQGAEEGSCSFSKTKLKTKYEKKYNEKEAEAPLQQKIPKYQNNLSNISAPKQSNNAAPSPMKKSKLCQESSQVTGNKSNINRKVQMNTPLSNHGETTVDTDIDLDEIDDFLDDEIKRRENTTCQAEEEPTIKKLCYKWKDKSKEYPIQEVNGKMKCPICGTLVKSVQLHLKRNIECCSKVDHAHFTAIFGEYIKQERREKDRKRKEIKNNMKKNEGKEFPS